MQKLNSKQQHPYGILISSVVLVFLLAFTYGLLFVAPYPGFYFNPSDGRILEIYQHGNPTTSLLVGDVVEMIGSSSLDEFHKNKNLIPFEGIKQGQTITIVVSRNNESLTVPWIYPGFNRPEFLFRFFNIWWLAYIFWFIGISTQLFMRPKDIQWRLFVAINYLTAMFLILGSVSSYQIMRSAILLRSVAWLTLPAYLHFHWIFPMSLWRVHRHLKVIFYFVFCGIAVGELFQLVPSSLFFFAVILAFGGSIVLLILHFIFQQDHRRDVRFLVVAAFLALFPAVIISITGSSGQVPQSGPLSLLALPILPGAYFYVLYGRRLGKLELRVNRAISLYLFLVLVGMVLVIILGRLGVPNISREAILFFNIIVAVTIIFLSIQIFPAFQLFVERRLLGIKLPGQNLSETYSARIITSDTLSGLLKLLRTEVFPSLLIRQYVFVRNLETSVRVMLSENVTQDQVREETLMELFASLSQGSLHLPEENGQPFDWVHLILPLQYGSDLIGVWLLGRRDPDDHYPQAERPILQSLANQTAVAMSNIIQTERLRTMYEANIDRYEQEKLRLAHDLHDSLLNEMAAMLMKHEPSSLPQDFQESFDGLIVKLREIVSDLRPPMLMYGLKFALEGMVDNFSERNQDMVNITLDIQDDGRTRYPETVENNLYRIVQEACENALKYSHAESIGITGKLSPEMIDLKVNDDGVGFNTEISFKLDDMLANKHFGLAGMHERTDLIGAVIGIESTPEQGTQIRVTWETKNSI